MVALNWLTTKDNVALLVEIVFVCAWHNTAQSSGVVCLALINHDITSCVVCFIMYTMQT